MDKPLIQWNSQSEVRKPYKPNHICMFQERQLLEDVSKHAEYLKTENGFVVRLKKYSSLYQDYMLYKHTLNDEIIPAGCIELCCNNLHVTKDLSMIPVLSTILNNVMPVSPFFLISSRSISPQRKRRSQATKQRKAKRRLAMPSWLPTPTISSRRRFPTFRSPTPSAIRRVRLPLRCWPCR